VVRAPATTPGYTGISLRRRLRTLGGLSLAEASYLFDRIAETIDGLHHHGIRHGAICPENIWLLQDGTIRIFQPAGPVIPESDAHMAHIGYMAPEERAGKTPTSAADIWALGNLLFDVLAGTAAPESGPRAGKALETIGVAVEPAGPVIDMALALAPERRYHSAQAVANALWAVVPEAMPAGEPAAVEASPAAAQAPAASQQPRPLVFGSGPAAATVRQVR
jgi:serine/threonine-protein kinase